MVGKKQQKTTEEFIEYVEQTFSKKNIIETVVFKDEITWTVMRSNLVGFLEFLRDDNFCRFSRLLDVTAVDEQQENNRFSIVYHLQSIDFKRNVRVKTKTDTDIPVASATSVFPSANWYEREILDMFGIPFSGHNDLRCILTDEYFKGEPLRKDFPLIGEKKLRYDSLENRFYYQMTPDDEKKPVNKAKVTELG